MRMKARTEWVVAWAMNKQLVGLNTRGRVRVSKEHLVKLLFVEDTDSFNCLIHASGSQGGLRSGEHRRTI